MFLNKFNVASLLLVSTAFLAGCTANQSSTNTASMNSESKQAAVKTEPVAQEKSDNSYPESQNILNNALERSPNGLGKQGSENLNVCIRELSSLKALSPEDYNRLVGSFKEVSDINQLYKQIEATASPDTIELLQMAIESKTKVLCAKVRYSAVLSTESTLQKINGL
ncbi:Uncharacterised protein [Providencia rustigianii]|uniref:Lipoprotein n=2 Tax=Providencia rustigianii TaxID=158850 RepID=D1P3Y0_9GAMM|nr:MULTISPECIES: hypothetical protein [Providencia]EFB71606.1 hypothetical protein PROVRUST_06930 [Providencia rustigianii DSM 4541]MTC55315.1 hypothetical protein [Providencia rustigianii]MTC59963.1 hypothetical protein [Providencia rustigianii]SUC27910.1 Uncharacterised protein [Providencia rustigianii]SUC36290.1 Uncharacterised protein [Providencia rustigianii]